MKIVATKMHEGLKQDSPALLCFLRPFAAGLILLDTAAGMAFQLTPKQLPPPFQTPSANNRPQVIPQPDGAQIKLPAGFNAEVIAEGFDGAAGGSSPEKVRGARRRLEDHLLEERARLKRQKLVSTVSV